MIGWSLHKLTPYIWIVAAIFCSVLLSGCQGETTPRFVIIQVDGAKKTLTTEVATVREALQEADIKLGPLDRVHPDLYTRLEPNLTIVVTRVKEEIDTQRETIPFERQMVINEALSPGESRLAQLGANGQEEISFRVVYEDGLEVSRTEIGRTTITPATPEILVIGPQDALPPVQFEGTIAYVANGNGWLMRNNSRSRRALTSDGKLDSRVFELAPDGRQVLYTKALTDEIGSPLNELWLASTTIVGEPPITIGIQGVLQAEWSPDVNTPRFAFSTAERTPNPPGWQANNDLWLLTPPVPDSSEGYNLTRLPQPVNVIPRNTDGLYPWWGTSFAWSPDGSRLAYARADQLGIINLVTNSSTTSKTITPLADFTPLQTFSDWVWVPGLSWSPDGNFIAATVHGPPLATEQAEESQVFDIWLFSADGALAAKVADEVGMWANPSWGPKGIAFGEAVNPLQSVNSRYLIKMIDHDGSNAQQLFPFQTEPGVQVPQLVWAPDGQQLLFVYNGNLHITNYNGGIPKQLSNDGQATQPQWALANTLIFTNSDSITNSATLTPDDSRTATPTRSATATSTATSSPSPAATATATATLSATATRTPTATSQP